MEQNRRKNGEQKRKTILIADDEKNIRALVIRACSKKDFDVIEARDGVEALSKFRSCQPDVVLLDIMMPAMDGYTACSMMRTSDFFTPIIMLTGLTNELNKAIAAKLGATAYITKPFSAEQLVETIEKNLEKAATLLEALRKENERLKEALNEIIENVRKSEDVGASATSEGIEIYRAMCGAIAHSLRGEFVNIGASAQNIREIAHGSDDIQQECQIIERGLEYSQLSLRRLLDYFELGKSPKDSYTIVWNVLEKTEELVMPRLPSNIVLEIAKNEKIKNKKITGDIEQIVGIVVELISNSISALRVKGGSIKVKTRLHSKNVAIYVEDTGDGMPKEIMNKVFKEQVSSKKGLGLGLFLSRKVATELGGELRLETSSEKGTSIVLELPMVRG